MQQGGDPHRGAVVKMQAVRDGSAYSLKESIAAS